MEQKVVEANSGSKNLHSKMKRLYAELNNRMENKDGLDELFGQVMNSEEPDNRPDEANREQMQA